MLLGTDVSIEVCKAESYTIIKYDGRKKFDVNMPYTIMRFYPDYYEIEYLRGTVMYEIDLSFNDLLEMYEDDKESIDSFAETNMNVDFEKPTYYDFLMLANDIDAYKGLY